MYSLAIGKLIKSFGRGRRHHHSINDALDRVAGAAVVSLGLHRLLSNAHRPTAVATLRLMHSDRLIQPPLPASFNPLRTYRDD